MNARKARERRKATPPRVEDRPVHRTRPLAPAGTLIGHGCDCCGRVFTAAGRLSQPTRLREDGITVAASKTHRERVKALRQTSGLLARLRRARR